MMKTILSSPIKDAANNIVLKPKALRTKKDYENFIKWLDTSNRDLKKIKIPDKRKIEKLELKFGDGFYDEGDSEGSPLIPLIGGGLGGLVFGGGKKLLGKMFPKAAEKAAEELKRVNEVVKSRGAEASILRINSTLQDRIAAAQQVGDKQLVARLEGQQREVDLQYQYAKALADEKDVRAQAAIVLEGQTALIANQNQTQRE